MTSVKKNTTQFSYRDRILLRSLKLYMFRNFHNFIKHNAILTDLHHSHVSLPCDASSSATLAIIVSNKWLEWTKQKQLSPSFAPYTFTRILKNALERNVVRTLGKILNNNLQNIYSFFVLLKTVYSRVYQTHASLKKSTKHKKKYFKGARTLAHGLRS